jgi:hypothetical protein
VDDDEVEKGPMVADRDLAPASSVPARAGTIQATGGGGGARPPHIRQRIELLPIFLSLTSSSATPRHLSLCLWWRIELPGGGSSSSLRRPQIWYNPTSPTSSGPSFLSLSSSSAFRAMAHGGWGGAHGGRGYAGPTYLTFSRDLANPLDTEETGGDRISRAPGGMPLHVSKRQKAPGGANGAFLEAPVRVVLYIYRKADKHCNYKTHLAHLSQPNKATSQPNSSQ